MAFLRRLFRPGTPAGQAEPEADVVRPDDQASEPAPPAAHLAVPCPYCAVLLDPPPARDRLCPRCRRRIVVRRTQGRLVLLTEAAVAVFEAERRRDADERSWAAERARWLELAGTVSAPAARVARVSAAALSGATVSAARELYMATAERAVRTARREKRWSDVARIRHDQAAAMHRALARGMPPSDEIVALHREWSAAHLRSLVGYAREVELVGAGCCAACRRDDGRAFSIAAELAASRLPHEGCPKGLCACDWWPLPIIPKRRRQKPRRRKSRERENSA